jgi:EAL domain-containing protein (putative c-di-GMP-specific phosphodiesterase class I)
MGRNRIHTFTHDDEDIQQRHGEMQFVERINHALEENRFVLHRQIISSLQDNNTAPSYEYLVRLLDEEGNLLYPGTFMPAAERFELMPKLDRWVVSHVFEHLQSCEQSKHTVDGLPAAFINLSGQVFSDEAFPGFIIEEAQRFRLDPQLVCLEITETSAIRNFNTAGEFINRLRRAGFKFALDDFGTGMSSFSYLQSLHVDFLKIDGVFCENLDNNDLNPAIIEAITNIGHKTQLKVIAEWIETQDVQDKLTRFGVDFGQGYFIGKPEPLPGHPELHVARTT